MVAQVLDRHIEITPGVSGGKPHIAGHRITVQNIVIWHERMGKSVDEICAEYDLTLAEVYTALAYYFDHRDEIDQDIKKSEAFVATLRERTPSILESKLKARRQLSKIRYYTDEHVAKVVVRGLRQRGVDVLTVPEANKLGADDEAQLIFALAEGRVFFTQDDDFLRLAAAGKAHVGIVYAPQQTPISKIIQGLMLIYQVLDAEEMVGNIEYL